VITLPLVSCLMPTYNRRAFVPRAIQYFLRQDYPNKELVILDDGSDPVEDLVPPDGSIRYIRLAKKTPLGAKRNQACQAARGDLLMHWDDDDWMAPHRIRCQVEALLAQGAEICGLRQMLFFDPRTDQTWLYTYPANQRPWLAGGSLLYTRAFWKQAPFPPVEIGEDTRFIWSRPLPRWVCLPDYRFYVALIHQDNTSAKRTGGPYWSRWNGDLREVMGDDLEFYRPGVQPLQALERPVAVGAGEEQSQQAPVIQVSEKPLRVPGPSPRVSCILATGNRLGFTRQAIRCFLRQTYDDSELVVVDDGKEPAADLCKGLLRVRYIRLDRPTLLGTKLNIGVQHARGIIIQKLDDDDYYHPQFLERAVSNLKDRNGKGGLVAWDCFLVLLAGERLVRFSGHGWAAGGTLCFHRALWEQRPFRDLPREVDAWFLRDHNMQVNRICAPDLYILVRHGRNTWREQNGRNVNSYFAQKPFERRSIEALVEPIDLPFYSSLKMES